MWFLQYEFGMNGPLACSGFVCQPKIEEPVATIGGSLHCGDRRRLKRPSNKAGKCWYVVSTRYLMAPDGRTWSEHPKSMAIFYYG